MQEQQQQHQNGEISTKCQHVSKCMSVSVCVHFNALMCVCVIYVFNLIKVNF